MDFKLLKLNLKIAWLKATGKLKYTHNILDFSSTNITSPNILVIFPIEDDNIEKSMDAISEISRSQKENNATFTFIINSSMVGSMNFYDIKTLTMNINKRGKITNINNILNEIYAIDFDIIMDLNTNFRYEIGTLVNELTSKFKIGFISEYSDLFYNIQLKQDEQNNGFETIKNIIG